MRSDREERIRQRAYTIWQSEGHQHGLHEDHWHRAEREIAAEETPASKAPRQAGGSGKAPAQKPAAAKPARNRNSGARSTRVRKPAAED